MTMLRILLLFFCCGCVSSDSKDIKATASNLPCSRTVEYGKREYCLPVVDKMKECYSHPAAIAFSNKMKHEGMKIFGMYTTEHEFNNIANVEETGLDAYIYVFASDGYENNAFYTTYLDEAAKAIVSTPFFIQV